MQVFVPVMMMQAGACALAARCDRQWVHSGWQQWCGGVCVHMHPHKGGQVRVTCPCMLAKQWGDSYWPAQWLGEATVCGVVDINGVGHLLEFSDGQVWFASKEATMMAPQKHPGWASAALQAGMARLRPQERSEDRRHLYRTGPIAWARPPRSVQI